MAEDESGSNPSDSSISKRAAHHDHYLDEKYGQGKQDLPPLAAEIKKRHVDDKSIQYPKAPACADCKRLKVRCVRSDPNNINSDCLRCIKKQLVCITGLHAKRSNLDRSRGAFFEESRTRKSNQRAKMRLAPIGCQPMRDQLLNTWKLLTTRDDMRLQLLEKFEFTTLAKPANNVMKRGLLNREQITHRLRLYRDKIYPKFPIVQCPDIEMFETTMNELPVLFHTILDISSLVVQDESQKEASLILHNMVLRTVIDEIMLVSIKNLELLQCLVLLTQWYNESELYHQQRLNVLTTLALSVSYDLGMGGVNVAGPGSKAPPFEQMVAPQAATDVHTTESYKIWIAVYTTMFQILMANRRPIKTYWNKYTEMAVEHLKNICLSSDLPKAQFEIWEIAQLRHVQERIVQTLYKSDNEPSLPDYNDQDVQFLIERLDTDIAKIETAPTTRSIRRSLALATTRMFLHQAVLYKDYVESVGRAPFTNFSLNLQCGPLSIQAVRSYRTLVQSAKLILDISSSSALDILAPETSTFWTAVTLACDLLLKCRSCTIFNRYFASACFVENADLERVTKIVDVFDHIVKEYPNCNNALSFGFFIKLLLCHHDARVHHHSTRLPQDLLGDPQFIMQISAAAQRSNEGNSMESNIVVPINDPQDLSAYSMNQNDLNGINFQINGMTRNGLENVEIISMDSNVNGGIPNGANVNEFSKYKDYEGSILNGQMENREIIGNGSDTMSNANLSNSENSYIQMAPFPDMSAVNEQTQIDTPQLSDSDFSGSQMPLFEDEPVDINAAALNNIEAFWNDLINQTGSTGSFGFDFPV